MTTWVPGERCAGARPPPFRASERQLVLGISPLVLNRH